MLKNNQIFSSWFKEIKPKPLGMSKQELNWRPIFQSLQGVSVAINPSCCDKKINFFGKQGIGQQTMFIWNTLNHCHWFVQKVDSQFPARNPLSRRHLAHFLSGIGYWTRVALVASSGNTIRLRKKFLPVFFVFGQTQVKFFTTSKAILVIDYFCPVQRHGFGLPVRINSK